MLGLSLHRYFWWVTLIIEQYFWHYSGYFRLTNIVTSSIIHFTLAIIVLDVENQWSIIYVNIYALREETLH